MDTLAAAGKTHLNQGCRIKSGHSVGDGAPFIPREAAQ